jgi:glycosyltransferase involved in cell wall biosynthesis
MDIVFVGTLPPHQGGTAVMAYQLLNELSSAGHRVRAVAPLASADWATDPLGGRMEPGVTIQRFEMPYLETNTFEGASQAYRNRQTQEVYSGLKTLCSARTPDVILVGRSSFIWGIPAFAQSLGVPVVLWEHMAADALEQRDREMYSGTYFSEIKKADRIVVCCRHAATRFPGMGFVKVDAAVNGVDTKLFAPRPADSTLRSALFLETANEVAVHVSNLKPAKRPLDIVHCASLLRDEYPNLVWLIVGDGDKRDEMATEATRMGVFDQMRFAGWVEHREVNRYINLADLSVLPSETEGLPLAYLESMACGVPVVASDIPAAREVTNNSEVGLLHGVGNIDALANAVAGLLANRERLARM